MPCPDDDRLRSFHLGMLPAPQIEELHRHLEYCDTCSGRLDVLELESDIVLEAIRKPMIANSQLSAITPPAKAIASSEVCQPDQESSCPEASATPTNDRGTRLQACILEPGSRVGDYELIEEVDAGGMGRIFQARHLHMGRVVAIKFLNNVHATEAIARFQREIETSARLIHANIVTALDAGQLGSEMLYLVMEFVDGENLAKRIKRVGPMNAVEAVDCATQAADAISYLHQRRIVHRDVKPHNLMLSKDGHVKLLDMGIVRLVDGSQMAATQDTRVGSQTDQTLSPTAEVQPRQKPRPDAGTDQTNPKDVASPDGITRVGSSTRNDTNRDDAALTRATAILGSVSYMAPEQTQGTCDHRADIYGLGCTLYFLLTGRPPYHAETIDGLQQAHREAEIPSARSLRKEIPTALDRVCRRAMAKDPRDRYQTMEAMHESLQRVGASGRGTRRWFSALAAAFVFLVAGVVYRIETNTGVLLIESFDEDVEVIVKRNGEQIEIVDTKTNNRVELHAGEYELELASGSMRELSDDRLEMVRGEVVIVKVSQERPLELATIPFSKEKANEFQNRVAKRLKLSKDWTSPGGIDFVLIPPGTMTPRSEFHQTLTQPYYLGANEVTVGQFEAFVQETDYVTDPERSGLGSRVSPVGKTIQDASKGGSGSGYQGWRVKGANWRQPGYEQTNDHPVTLVSYRDAKAFADWLSEKDGVRYRIPTYAEWIWAHHAGVDDAVMAKPDYRIQHGWFSDAGFAPHPVRRRDPNAFGLFDTFGNVFEWTSDGLPSNARGWEINPIHETKGFHALSRGGCYATPKTAPSFSDYQYEPRSGSNAIGFRLLREVKEASPVQASGILALSRNAEVEVEVLLGESPVATLHEKQRSKLLPAGSYELRVASRPRWKVVPPKIGLRFGMVETINVVAPQIPDYELTAPFDPHEAKQAQQDCAQAIDEPIEWKHEAGMRFTLVPPGTMQIRDGLIATVTKPFYLGTYETTVAQFQKFVEATGYETDAERLGNGFLESLTSSTPDPDVNWRSPGFEQSPDDPACVVSWKDAVAFCEWMSKQDGRTYRLPSRAESELARWAGLKTYPTAAPAQSDLLGWFANDSEIRTHPVGPLDANPYGLYDVFGNVSEWVLDCPAPSMQGWYEDPIGKEQPNLRLLATGGNYKSKLSSYGGGLAVPTAGLSIFGFRVVCEVPITTTPEN